jgi:hypothetical protein
MDESRQLRKKTPSGVRKILKTDLKKLDTLQRSAE